MSKNHPSLSAEMEEEIRTTMALNRGIEWMQKIQQQGKSTRGDFASLKLGKLEQLFHDTHDYLFQDWKGNENEDDKVAGANRLKFREAIENNFFRTDAAGIPRLFDDNGFAIRFEPAGEARAKFAEKLANFYEEVRSFEPPIYSYGNKLTLDFFLVALSKLPALAEVYPEGIDFRRMDSADLQTMQEQKLEHKQVVAAFMHATDPSIVHPLMNLDREQDGKTGYQKWDDKTEYIGGVPFLSHEDDGVKYLVTMNGGLTPLTEQLKEDITKYFEKGGLISEFEMQKATKYIKLPELPNLKNEEREKLENSFAALKNSEEISGVMRSKKQIEEGVAPLLCLDVNVMSGLRPASNSQLMEFLEQNKDIFQSTEENSDGKSEKRKKNLAKLDLLDNPPSKNISKEDFLKPLLARANGNPRMEEILKVAYDHVNANMRHIETDLAEKFKDVKPVATGKTPRMYMSMGGSGSGKTVVETIVKAECGEEGKGFVVSALDSFREYNPINTLLLAAGHHADDYSIIDPYASELRERVTKKAREDMVNILCDGSGIDYKGRNDETVERFKNAKFHTQVVAVETDYNSAVERVNGRYQSKNRAMPWIRVADKHINFAPSFLDAVADKNLDKTSLISADLGIGKQYVIAETVNQTKGEIKELNAAKKTGLYDSLMGILTNVQSIAKTFKIVPKTGKDGIKDITNIPNVRDNKKTTFITYPNIGGEGKDRVLAVYNGEALDKMLNKGKLNQNANAPQPELLQHTKKELEFYMPKPVNTKDGGWRLHLVVNNDVAPQKQSISR